MTENRSVVIAGLVVGRKRNGRCVYSVHAKRVLVEACLRPGVSVARMALTHGVNANLLRKWISRYRGKREAGPRSRAVASGAMALLPVMQLGESAPEQLAAQRAADSRNESLIEIVLAEATLRLHGRVDVRQLREVIDCVVRR